MVYFSRIKLYVHFELCSLNIFKRLLGNDFKITQHCSCTKAWKIESKSRSPECIFAFQHHLVPGALIEKHPLQVFVLKSRFDRGWSVLQCTDKQEMNQGWKNLLVPKLKENSGLSTACGSLCQLNSFSVPNDAA